MNGLLNEPPRATMRFYANVGVLVLDEVGYLAADNRNAELLLHVVSRRYEKKSLVMTTNLAFKDWHTNFPTATCATALIERVVHHADVVKRGRELPFPRVGTRRGEAAGVTSREE